MSGKIISWNSTRANYLSCSGLALSDTLPSFQCEMLQRGGGKKAYTAVSNQKILRQHKNNKTKKKPYLTKACLQRFMCL